MAAIELLFVDADLVVANKPSGIVVHRGWANDDDVAMFRVRDALGQHVHPVHRLDRGTSGALVFARTREMAAAMASAFEEGRIDKGYLALVRGHPPAEGTVDYPLAPQPGAERVPAVTHFRTVASSSVDRCSLVEARPVTGRLHQIRRHLRHLSHPLVGDVTHGSGPLNRHYRATYGLHRLALHAHRVAFTHPRTDQRLDVRAPLPDDLAGPLRTLGFDLAPWRSSMGDDPG